MAGPGRRTGDTLALREGTPRHPELGLARPHGIGTTRLRSAKWMELGRRPSGGCRWESHAEPRPLSFVIGPDDPEAAVDGLDHDHFAVVAEPVNLPLMT